MMIPAAYDAAAARQADDGGVAGVFGGVERARAVSVWLVDFEVVAVRVVHEMKQVLDDVVPPHRAGHPTARAFLMYLFFGERGRCLPRALLKGQRAHGPSNLTGFRGAGAGNGVASSAPAQGLFMSQCTIVESSSTTLR